MVSKRGLSTAFLLLLVMLLAGCSGLFPSQPQTPPVDARHGALDVHVDLAELVAEDISIGSAKISLARSSGSIINQQLHIVGDEARATIEGMVVGGWEATLRLYDETDSDSLAVRTDSIEISDRKTTSLNVIARFDGNKVSLHIDAGDGDGDGDDGTDPGDGDDDDDDDDGTDPGDGNGGDGDDDTDPTPPSVTREVRYIQSGSRTETRTEVYIIRSSEPGPTVMLVGGVHGGETSGWIVAGEVAETWDIDRGTLVVLPEANKDAVNRRRRTGNDGRDLNRAFPFGRPINRPTDWLMAQEIWSIVEEFQPSALLDLHEGWGLREANDRFPGGTLSVGQTLIAYNVKDAHQFADHVINVLNRDHNPYRGIGGWTYTFRRIGPPAQGSLAYKAGRDLGIPAFIAEPTQGRTDRHSSTLEQRKRWHRVFAEEFMRWYGVLD